MTRELFATKLTAIWVGGAFFWSLSFFKGSYKDFIVDKYEIRNAWVGYLLTLIFICSILFFVLKEEI